eukprot:454851-Prymnesium_polylepis.1
MPSWTKQAIIASRWARVVLAPPPSANRAHHTMCLRSAGAVRRLGRERVPPDVRGRLQLPRD